MRPLLVIAGHEVREALRNRWAAAATGLLALLALGLAFLGTAPVGEVAAERLAVTTVSLSSLVIYLLPLIALLISFDAVVGEHERGTLLLLLAYPVARWQVLGGKFLGQAAIIAGATVIGFGSAATAVGAVAPPSAAAWWGFLGLIAASVLLGWAFLALGLLVSVVVRERTTAAGVAVVVWLVLVVLYDLALLGVLAATGGEGGIGNAVPALLLANPADAYRLVMLTGSDAAAALTGFGDAAQGIAPVVPVAALAAWVVVPLAVAWVVFRRREP